eukprot:700550-Rhodomonas_salina.1
MLAVLVQTALSRRFLELDSGKSIWNLLSHVCDLPSHVCAVFPDRSSPALVSTIGGRLARRAEAAPNSRKQWLPPETVRVPGRLILLRVLSPGPALPVLRVQVVHWQVDKSTRRRQPSARGPSQVDCQ